MHKFLPVLVWLSAALPAATETADLRGLRILQSQCVQCHSSSMTMGGLDLTSREAVLKGGHRGPAIEAGKSANSRLIQAVLRQGTLVMPPTKTLPAADVETLRQWIDGGFTWPDTAAKQMKSQAPEWWAFKKPVRHQAPASASAWARNDIDQFILSKLAAANLKPSPEAGRATLIRRLSFDLIGLPPSAAEVRAFVEDKSADAYAKLVDRLLASPHYGEKWGRHWLDLVRYADTAGFELDSYISDAWRYRDYVIQSFNEDKPYDRFLREQIAADELFPEDPVAQTGTGLYCVGPNRDLFPDQADINREEVLTDYVDTTSSVFLGMTAGCARCHDHKFDPIPQRDYYSVQAIFAPAVKTKVALSRLASLGYDVAANSREIKLREIGEQIRAAQTRCKTSLYEGKLNQLPPDVQDAIRADEAQKTPRQKELASQFTGQLRVSDDEVRACMTPEETKKLAGIERRLVSMFAEYRAKPFACGLADLGNHAPRTFIPARGGRDKQEVQPGFFSVLGGGTVPPPADSRESTGPIPLQPTTGRRTALAGWIAHADNPLTARVMVNRIWQYHFGRGIVFTPSDFGTRGRQPTHPELLDWLATEFIARGWSVKQMHRLILTSATYRQSSLAGPAAAEKDPENLLLSHFARRRIASDEIRDSVLQVTAALNKKQGGRPVVPPLGKEELYGMIGRADEAWIVTDDASEHTRRSVYILQKRTFRLPMLEVFDTPESMLTCPRRESSTTAPQSLTLLNGSFVMEHARRFGSQLAKENPEDARLIDASWTAILARAPSVPEKTQALRFLADQSANTGGRDAAATELVRGLLNINEFLYVD